MMLKTPWLPALTLLTATLMGCAEGGSPRATTGAQTPAGQAPVVAGTPCSAPEVAAEHLAASQPAASQPAAAKLAAEPAAEAPRPAKRAPRASAAEVSAQLKIKRLVLAEGVEGREPVDAATSFSASEAERIYAFVEVENGAGEDAEITVAFEPPDGGASRGNVALTVGPSPRWRTWAFTRGARVPGAWEAVVRAPNGDVLARAPFEITL